MYQFSSDYIKSNELDAPVVYTGIFYGEGNFVQSLLSTFNVKLIWVGIYHSYHQNKIYLIKNIFYKKTIKLIEQKNLEKKKIDVSPYLLHRVYAIEFALVLFIPVASQLHLFEWILLMFFFFLMTNEMIYMHKYFLIKRITYTWYYIIVPKSWYMVTIVNRIYCRSDKYS